MASPSVDALASDDEGFVVGGHSAFDEPVTIIDSTENGATATALPPIAPSSWWGTSVARSNGRIAIGAPATLVNGSLLGSVTILERDPFGVWMETATVTGVNAGELFGWSVALADDVLVVGSPYAMVDGASVAGVVRTFRHEGQCWVPVSTLEAETPATQEQFGSTVAIADGWLAVGAVGATQDGAVSAGEVRVFVRDGATCTPQATIVPPVPEGNARFGHALSIDGKALAIGAPGVSVDALHDGAVYSTMFDGRGWSPLVPVAAGVPVQGLGFGTHVFISGERLVAAGDAAQPWSGIRDYRWARGAWELVGSFPLDGPVARFGAHVAAIWTGDDTAVAVTAIDLSCEPPEPGNDCDNSYLPDDCQIQSDGTLDLDGDGVIDTCPIVRSSLVANFPAWNDALGGHIAHQGTRTLVWPQIEVDSAGMGYQVGPLQLVDMSSRNAGGAALDGAFLGTGAGSPLALEADWLAAAGGVGTGVSKVLVGSIGADGAAVWTDEFVSEATGDAFGWALASTADTLYATTPGDPNGAYPIRRFVRDAAGAWSEVAPLALEEPEVATGLAIAIDEAHLAVSDLSPADGTWMEGRIRVFGRSGEEFVEESSLRVPTSSPGARLGTKLKLAGSRLYAIAGPPGDPVTMRQRRLYVFRETASGWAFETEVPIQSPPAWSRSFDVSALQVALGHEGAGVAVYVRRANGSWALARTFGSGVRGFAVQAGVAFQSPSTIGTLIVNGDDGLDQSLWWYDPVDDCDGDGVDDSDQRGGDLDGNGILDACDPPGDMDVNGVVDAVDLAILLGRFGLGPGLGDCNDDGTVGADDLAILLAGWS